MCSEAYVPRGYGVINHLHHIHKGRRPNCTCRDKQQTKIAGHVHNITFTKQDYNHEGAKPAENPNTYTVNENFGWSSDGVRLSQFPLNACCATKLPTLLVVSLQAAAPAKIEIVALLYLVNGFAFFPCPPNVHTPSLASLPW